MEMFIGAILIFIILLWLFEKEAVTYDDANGVVEFRSRFSRFGDPTAPERIIITSKQVTWKKNQGVNNLWLFSDSMTMPLGKVTAVAVHERFIGCSIEITSQGFASIYARNFRLKEARIIQQMLMS